jgi:hypothetical protein
MKKKILVVLCFFKIFQSLFAQVDAHPWTPTGATWLYQATSQMSVLYFKFVYQKDTLAFGKEVKKIVVTKFEYIGIVPNLVRTRETFVSNEYMYNSHDSVFWYNNNQFQLLYVFSAGNGASWVVQKSNYFTCLNPGTPDTNTLTIRNVQQLLLANRQFTVMDANPQPYWTIGTRIVKNIGSMKSLFPVPGNAGCSVIDGNVGIPEYLTCYYDNLRGNLDFGGNGKCQELISATQDVYEKNKHNTVFTIFPNPASSTLNILSQSHLDIERISVFDMFGKPQMAVKYTGNNELDIDNLPNGIYIIVIQASNHLNYSIKFIKAK